MYGRHIWTATLLCLLVGCQSVNQATVSHSTESGELSRPLVLDDSPTVAVSDLPGHTAEAVTTEGSPVTRTSNVRQVVCVQPFESEDGLLDLEPTPAPQPVELADTELSLDVLEGMALQNNPALAQSTADVEAARGTWVQTGLPPNPVLGYSGQQLGSGGVAEQQGVYLGQEIVTGKKLHLNREAASWEIERAVQELEAVRLRVLTDVRIAYYEVLIAQRRRELAAELVRISEQAVETAESLLKGLEVSEADPLRARVEADTARIILQTSINQHVEAWRQLAAVLGMPDLSLQRITGELKPDAIDLAWQETLQQVLRESPEIATLVAEAEAARWAVKRSQAEVIPNVEVQAVIQDDRGTGSNNLNLQVSLPIPILNRNQGGIRRAVAQAAAAEQAVDRMALNLQVRLAAAFQRYESALNQVNVYTRKDGILDKTERSLELIRAGYEGGEIGVLDLLSVQRTYFRTNLAYLDSQSKLWASVMEIKGLLLQGSLQSDPGMR